MSEVFCFCAALSDYIKGAEKSQYLYCQSRVYVEKKNEQDYWQTADPHHAASSLSELGLDADKRESRDKAKSNVESRGLKETCRNKKGQSC